MRWLLLMLVMAFAAGCGAEAASGPPEVTVAEDQRDLVGAWRDAQGIQLPDGSLGVMVISSNSGSTRCSKENVTVFLELSWPAGRRLNWNGSSRPGDTNRYVRDTDGSAMDTDMASDLDTALPVGATETGINREGNALYVITSKPQAVWIRRADGHVERWARLGAQQGCA